MNFSLRSGRWRVEYLHGSAIDMHARKLPREPFAAAWIIEPSRPAVVLGKSQPRTDVNEAAAASLGFEVARRESGGGAVLIVPGKLVWIDVIVPAGDVLWDDDVSRASYWLGDVWAEVLGSYGYSATVHRGGLRSDSLARTFCFAGLGPGEVVVDNRKVVGLSQRRTRDAARFQCACILDWNPEDAFAVLPILKSDYSRVVTAGMGLDFGLARTVLPTEVVERFIEALTKY